MIFQDYYDEWCETLITSVGAFIENGNLETPQTAASSLHC